VAYPALDADENGVHLRLFRSAPEALRKHRLGVKALFALRFREELRHLRKGIAPVGDLKLWAAAFGGAKALENVLCEKVMHDLLEADVRTAEAFLSHAEKVRPQLLPRGQNLLKTLRPLIKSLYDVTELFRTLEIANRGNRPFLTFLAGLREELAALLPADFLIRYNEERIVHINRYLRALALRAERGAVHLEKALTRTAEIRDLRDCHRKIGEGLPSYASEEKRKAIEDLVWMIEEYKVSLFAQELKTPFPISRKRLDARIEEIERML
jgi:ATP-dependent helicase HrpA